MERGDGTLCQVGRSQGVVVFLLRAASELFQNQ